MKKTQALLALAAFLINVVSAPAVQAYEIPGKDSKIQYLYVFGPEGNPKDGKEDSKQLIFIDIPESVTENMVVRVYDPDTAGALDGVGGYPPYENTQTEFSVWGEKMLDKKVFGAEREYDRNWYKFGPFDPKSGKKVGNMYRFILRAEGVKGDDQNLFRADVKPENSEAFSDNITFRLRSGRGDKGYFYPEVPQGVTNLVVENYDLDSDGGVSHLSDGTTSEVYPVNDSTSGQWSQTNVRLGDDRGRRLIYQVTTKEQTRGNAGLRVKDDQGNLIPIYFKKGVTLPPVKPAPKPEPQKPVQACNRYIFDARESYDPNNDKITYAWDFGDGGTSTEPVIEHVFAQGGTYKVTLTVSDNSGLECETSVTNQSVNVNTPPQAAFSGPEKTCTGNDVTFNASATKDDQPANLTYSWSFSDGTRAEGQTVTKSFKEGGTYDVVLTVNDNAGTSCSVDSIRQVINVNAPPIAEAGEDKVLYLSKADQEYHVTFDGSKSRDLNGDELKYFWDFGDGASAQGKVVDHVYQQGGSYQVKLAVDDSSGSKCATDTDGLKVELNKAPVAEAGGPSQICQGGEVSFDGSASVTEAGETLSYNWDFGDGTSGTGVKASHAYQKGGEYRVTLTVNDERGTPVSQAVDSVNVTVNSRPQVKLQEVAKVCTSDTVSFDASGSGDADGDRLKYTWDFGDGTVAEGSSKMTHQYAKGGTYRVSVKVDDGRGLPCSGASSAVQVVVNTPPVANTGPNLVCCEDAISNFDGSGSKDGDGDALSYLWNFGDGQSSREGASVSHAYTKSGRYNVSLTVDDGSATHCSSSSSGFTADVNAKPVSVIKVKQS